MLKKNRGAALLQVLVITALLAGISVMILRAVLSRQVTVRQTRHTVSARHVIEACMAEVNAMWAMMTPEQYQTSLANCTMPDVPQGVTNCAGGSATAGEWYCRITPVVGAGEYCVTATMGPRSGATNDESPCKITYTIKDGVNL